MSVKEKSLMEDIEKRLLIIENKLTGITDLLVTMIDSFAKAEAQNIEGYKLILSVIREIASEK